jgi:hypothetical protein
VSKLALITKAPGVDLSFIRHCPTEIITTTDIDYFLSDEMVQKYRLILTLKTSCSQLSKCVISPCINLPIIAQSDRVVSSRLYLFDIV